jgi:chaperonin GroES
MNESGITPIGDRAVIKVKETETKTPGGIIILEKYKDKKDMAQLEATLLESGETADMKLEVWPETGDTVLITKYAGLLYTRNDIEYRLVRGEDIVGMIK